MLPIAQTYAKQPASMGYNAADDQVTSVATGLVTAERGTCQEAAEKMAAYAAGKAMLVHDHILARQISRVLRVTGQNIACNRLTSRCKLRSNQVLLTRRQNSS